jgi:hypothetical protein
VTIWTFFDSVAEDRRLDLERYDSFLPLLAGFRLITRVGGFVWESGHREDLRDCARAGYLLKMPSFFVDAFFNSPNGYRAQYALSPQNGELTNRQIIELLRPTLLAYSGSANADAIRRSLDGIQAKIWIDEDEAQVQQHYWDSTPEINFPRWLKNSEDCAGPRALIGTRLVLFGGWVDKDGSERLDQTKMDRSNEIHHCGFS